MLGQTNNRPNIYIYIYNYIYNIYKLNQKISLNNFLTSPVCGKHRILEIGPFLKVKTGVLPAWQHII